jgi:anti-sigma B factor antagonist
VVATGAQAILRWAGRERQGRRRDVPEVSYIDSSGIAALVEGAEREEQGQTVWPGLRQQAVGRLQLARLDRVFTIFPDLDAARAG